ncbi:MAG: hypothetical protein IRZ03_07540 [Acidobacterium ailaaui]|nr:hypothetical protein [Pseudacidobacterium ailaaui]
MLPRCNRARKGPAPAMRAGNGLEDVPLAAHRVALSIAWLVSRCEDKLDPG